jgi:hypothetical protein
MALSVQLFWLFVCAIPIASVAWTITHEEVLSEARQWCERNKRKECKFIPAEDDHAWRKVGLVQRRNHFSTRSQRALIDHLKHIRGQSGTSSHAG